MAAKTEGKILKAILEELEEYTTKIKTRTFIHSTKMEQNQQSGMPRSKCTIYRQQKPVRSTQKQWS